MRICETRGTVSLICEAFCFWYRYEILVSECIATFVAICILMRMKANYANSKDERPCVRYSLNLLL